jgi:hypothetical protein
MGAELERLLDTLKKARHSSGGVHPYLWRRPEKPPLRSGATADFIRFCAWLDGGELSARRPEAASASAFLRSKMLPNGAVPYEVASRTLTPVKECPYLVADSVSAALAGQACADEELVGRSLDFVRWCYAQAQPGRLLPMWHHFEAPQSQMPDHWSQQASCHQSVVARLDIDEMVYSTWGESVTDDVAAVMRLAASSLAANGLFDADRYRPDTPLHPHFITCAALLKYSHDMGDAGTLRTAADAAAAGVRLLAAGGGAGDTATPDGRLTGHRRTRLLAAAIGAGLMANAATGEEAVPRGELDSIAACIMDSRFRAGASAGLLSVSSDSAWEEDTLVCVPGCMAAFQSLTLLSASGLAMGDFRLLL